MLPAIPGAVANKIDIDLVKGIEKNSAKFLNQSEKLLFNPNKFEALFSNNDTLSTDDQESYRLIDVNKKNSIQSDLQSITSNNLLSIQMSGYVWCFYGLPKGSTLSFPQRSVWDLKLQKNNCTFNGRIQTSKETIDRANEEFGKLYEKRLDYFQSTIFFFIFLATMIMLSPTAWSDRVLYESNKDRMNAKVLTFSSTFKAGN